MAGTSIPMIENYSVTSYVTCNGVQYPYTSYSKNLDLDRTPVRRRKRTSGYNLTSNSLAGKLIVQIDPGGVNGTYGLPSPYEVPLVYTRYLQLSLADIEAQLIIDWDTGLERVFPEKIDQFNFVSQAFEFAELKTLSTAFAFRAIGVLRNILSGVTSVTLLNNLVVVPTMMSIRDFFTSKGDLYSEAIKKLKALQVPTKFSCQPVYRTKVFEVDHVVLAGASINPELPAFAVVVTERISVKMRKRGTGLLFASPTINRLLLSSLTSGFHIDLQTIWDRIPLSFVIDYFFGIGEVLGSDRIDICDFTAESCSEQTVIDVKSTFQNPRVIRNGNHPLDTSVSAKIEYPGYAHYEEFKRYAYPQNNQPIFDGLDPRQIFVSGDNTVSQLLNTVLILLGFVSNASSNVARSTRRRRR